MKSRFERPFLYVGQERRREDELESARRYLLRFGLSEEDQRKVAAMAAEEGVPSNYFLHLLIEEHWREKFANGWRGRP